MPAGIGIPHRIIPHVRVAIEVLRVDRVRHDGIRAQEAVNRRRVKSCAVVIDTQARDFPLAGEEFIREHTACCQTRLTKGIVSLLADYISTGIGHDTG